MNIKDVAKKVVVFSNENWFIEKKAVENNLSPKGNAVQKIIDSGDFGCYTKIVAELVSVLLNEKIVYRDESEGLRAADLPNGLAFNWDGIVFVINGLFYFVTDDGFWDREEFPDCNLKEIKRPTIKAVEKALKDMPFGKANELLAIYE